MRRLVAGLLLLAAVIVPLPATAAATPCAEALDAEATSAVQRAIKIGVRDPWTDFLDRANYPQPRADFAAYLSKMLGWKPDATWNERNPFVDVTVDWLAGPVAMLHVAGIIRGDASGHFDPYRPITADEARVIVARTLLLA
ncbi:MAG TPA: S-layer homology domain-containing protein, partial [Symbiobacteriaceae bacterium]|nr:S-layer homology domain-containing protein [Symbiobacteriaceae bacterium]